MALAYLHVIRRKWMAFAALPEAQAREVLDFVAFLKSRLQRNKSAQQDVSAFDRFGAVCEGHFNRDELYDRKVLR